MSQAISAVQSGTMKPLAKQLAGLALKQPKIYQFSLLALFDRLLTVDPSQDNNLRVVLRFLEHLFSEFMLSRLEKVGPILMRNALKHLSEVYLLHKLNGRIMLRAAFMILQILTVFTSHGALTAAQLDQGKASCEQRKSVAAKFELDSGLKNQLFTCVFQMMGKSAQTTLQQTGIQIKIILDPRLTETQSMQLLCQTLCLLSQSRSAEIRKRVIRSFTQEQLRQPKVLACVCRRIRDENSGVVHLIFKQLEWAKISLAGLGSKETRMTVIKEGMSHGEPTVR